LDLLLADYLLLLSDFEEDFEEDDELLDEDDEEFLGIC